MILRLRSFLVGKRGYKTFVSAKWLQSQLEAGNKNLRIIHASWNGCEDYRQAHIPDSVCFDGFECRDAASPYKNMRPSVEQFQEYVSERGVGPESEVVVYDATETPNQTAAPRVWFLFRLFGHGQVSLLDGGLHHWLHNAFPVTSDYPKHVSPGSFKANFRPELIKSFEEMVENIETGKELIVDTRNAARFHATEPDSFDTQPGRVPKSVNCPTENFLDPDTKLLKKDEELERLLSESAVERSGRLVSMCQTGMLATGFLAILHHLGVPDATLYDGSWYEFSRRAQEKLVEKTRQ